MKITLIKNKIGFRTFSTVAKKPTDFNFPYKFGNKNKLLQTRKDVSPQMIQNVNAFIRRPEMDLVNGFKYAYSALLQSLVDMDYNVIGNCCEGNLYKAFGDSLDLMRQEEAKLVLVNEKFHNFSLEAIDFNTNIGAKIERKENKNLKSVKGPNIPNVNIYTNGMGGISSLFGFGGAKSPDHLFKDVTMELMIRVQTNLKINLVTKTGERAITHSSDRDEETHYIVFEGQYPQMSVKDMMDLKNLLHKVVFESWTIIDFDNFLNGNPHIKDSSYNYEKLNEQLENMDKKSLDRLKQNLRDSYIQLKDITSRCLIDISNTEKGDKRIFYFKPDSILLEDPEKQKVYREHIAKMLSQPPKIKQNPLFVEELNKEQIEGIKDLSEPDDVREFLANFYHRRMYNLQQKKYKMLLRWAHFALTSEYLDRIGHHGTFTYGRLQYELENAIKRFERLNQDDDYGSIRDNQRQRPRTKGQDEEVSPSMYNEIPRKDPLSCLRMDDFEIFLRAQTYELKLHRTLEKFIVRVKWIPLCKGLEIFKEAHVLLKNNREIAFNEEKTLEQKVRKRFDSSIIKKTDDLIVQMEEILQLHYPSNYSKVHAHKQKAPIRITNIMELQLNIMERAAEFKIYGDIELDEGHSFTYQVNIFFTTYFQRQIVQSQFSLYDQTVRDMKDAYESNEVPDEEYGDINEIQRRNLKSLLLIDFQLIDYFNSNSDQNNVYLLKKGKKIIEQIPELKKNFSDIQVIRLKKVYWLDCVMLKPKIDSLQRQQNAFLEYNFQPDLLLEQIQDLVDLNDIATINTVYTDIAAIYTQLVQRQENMLNEIDRIVESSLVSDQEAKKILLHFTNALKMNIKENDHTKREQYKMKTMLLSKDSILRILPRHYIQSMYTLRHMKMKDTKTKLLYVLNFFRAIQKRITLDLREFAGREIVSENVDIKSPQEAVYVGKSAQMISGNISYSMKQKDEDERSKQILGNLKRDEELEKEQEHKGSYGEEDKTNLVDVKKWKYNNKFHNTMLSTCPVIPQFHSKHGEPLEDKGLSPDFTDSKSTNKTHITKKASQLLTRMDTFNVNDDTKEIFVIDDFGMHIMYDCSLDDMANLDKELLKIGTYFIRKNETSFDFTSFTFPIVDRFQLFEDLLIYEFEYQFVKAKIVMAYLDAYENICDPLEQERIMQVMTDIMSMRPRIELQQCEYFVESYKVEIQCQETHLKLIRQVIDYQMKNEKQENHQMKEYLQMTYKIANEYVNKKWSEQNAEDLQKQIKTRQVIQGGMRFQDVQEIQEQMKIDQQQKQDDEIAKQEEMMKEQQQQNNKERDSTVDKFAEILGLKNISMEKMLQNHTKSDETVEDVMHQDANFIKTQEGYPMFIKNSNDSLSKVTFTNYSMEIGVLDFFESLTIIPKVYSAMQIGFEETIEYTNPSNALEIIALNTCYLEKCFVEFKKCQAYVQDDLVEYKGSQFIENDLIMASPDKLMFLIKDMISHLTKTYKKNLNPLFVSKLDFYTIHNFTFPEMLREQMISSTEQRLDVNFTRNFIETQLATRGAQSRFFPKLREDDRKVNVPPMLLVFCNLVEVIRLRETMILNLSESVILGDQYNLLKDLVGRNNNKLLFQTPLNFETFTTSNEMVNFIEDGSLTEVDIDLAINEFDPNLRSNLNFMNSESVQCLVLDNGVAELRAAVHYQIMHKQLLAVSVRVNSKLLEGFRRMFIELELLQECHTKIENPIVDYNMLFRLNGTVNDEAINQMRSRLTSHLNSECGDLLQPLINIKQQLRTTVERKFKHTLHTLSSLKEQFHDIQSQVIQLPGHSITRLMRDQKISLLHCYCIQICKLNLIDAQRVQTMDVCWNLKKLMNVFPIEIGLYKLEFNEFKETFFQHAYFDKNSDFEEFPYFKNYETGDVNSFLTIPSPKTIMTLTPFVKDEKANFEKHIFDQDHLEYQLDHFRKNELEEIKLKDKQRFVVQALCKRSSEFPKQVLENTVIGRLFQVQKMLLDMFEIHYFFSKINFHPLESLQLDISSERMLPFWSVQDTLLEDQVITDIDDEELSEKILRKLINERKLKQSMNDELEQLGKTLRGVFIRMQSHLGTSTMSESLEYLSKYNQQIHYKLVGGILTLLENFYQKFKSEKALANAHWGFTQLSDIDLIIPTFQNGTVLPSKNIDSTQKQLNILVKRDFENFKLTVKGNQNEKELIDTEFILLEDIFAYALLENEKASYAGQITYKQYSYLNTLILGFEKEEINYLSSVYTQMENNLKELLEMDKITNDTSVYSLQKKANYFQDTIKSKLLYFGMIMLTNCQTISINSNYFNKVQLNKYKSDFSWKIDYEYQKKLNKLQYKGNQKQNDSTHYQRQQQLSQINEDKIQRQANHIIDQSIQRATTVQQAKNMSRDLQLQNIKSMHIMMKAIIKMSSREIERRLIKMAIDAINKQMSGISKCIEMCSKNVDKGIGNIQNFAPTFFDHLNRNSHLESINRVSQMQTLLTRMRNRGMDIETLTSGPGIVFTYKDLNECLQAFCTDLISYTEKESRTRTQTYEQIIQHQTNLLYIKDTRIDSLKRKIKLMFENITRIVNSRIYEKGNSLIFELDRSLRELRFYQDHIYMFETDMKEFVREEFRNLLQKKDMALDLHKKQVHDMSNQLVAEVKSHVLNEQKRIKKQIKVTARKMRDLDNFQAKPKTLMEKLQQNKNNLSDGHFSNSGRNDETGVKQTEWIISPEQAQKEVIEMQHLLSKQRTLWMLKFQTQQKHYEDQISILKAKLTSNQALWEQLQDSDKRTKILQQELIFTQKSLSQCEKIIEKLKEELKQSEQERIRLFQYKQNKASRLEELEYQVKKIDISEHINITKVIDLLSNKDRELTHLKQVEKNFDEKLSLLQEQTKKQANKWQKKYEQEASLKQQAIKKLNQFKDELKGIESMTGNQDPINNWKIKCKELFDICSGLASENSELITKIQGFSTMQDQTLNANTVVSKDYINKSEKFVTSNYKTRNQGTIGNMANGDSQAENLFASSNTNNSNLPKIKVFNSQQNPLAFQVQQQPQSTLAALNNSMLQNPSILNSKRFNDSSPLNMRSEYSDLSYMNLDQQSNSSLSQLGPIKPIQPIAYNLNTQYTNRITKSKNFSNQMKSQKRNSTQINQGAYDFMKSGYNPQAQLSSERHNKSQVKIIRELSVPKEIYSTDQTDRQNISSAGKHSLYSEEFLLKGKQMKK